MINPNTTFPIPNISRLCFLKNIINQSNIIIGDYTYYDDPVIKQKFAETVLWIYQKPQTICIRNLVIAPTDYEP